jgi:hypothetical protein
MKRIPVYFWGFVFLAMLLVSGCKTSEEEEVGILGTWVVIIQITEGPVIEETLTFGGTETSGTITGWYYEFGPLGTYTVTNSFDVEFIFDYVSPLWGKTLVIFNGTLTSYSAMNGTGTWYDDDLGSTYDFTWSATKL